MSRIELRIESSHDNSSLIGMAVNRICSEYFSESDVWGIELSVIEAINNVIQHAYNNNPKGIIAITLDFRSKFLLIDIQDRGQRPPENFLSDAQVEKIFDLDKRNVDCYPVDGMGIALIKMHMTKVDFFSLNGINTIRLLKNY